MSVRLRTRNALLSAAGIAAFVFLCPINGLWPEVPSAQDKRAGREWKRRNIAALKTFR